REQGREEEAWSQSARQPPACSHGVGHTEIKVPEEARRWCWNLFFIHNHKLHSAIQLDLKSP
ncbi:hypothetical protein LEMLEM_LOCUS8887, partial [Lemmus lemmus]